MLTLWQSVFRGAGVNAAKHSEVEAKMWEQVYELADAMSQLLDDMGKDGQNVCLYAKAKARLAYEPFRELGYDPGMSLEDAEQVIKETDN